MKGFSYRDSRGVSRLVSEKLDPHRLAAAEIGPAYDEYRRQWAAARAFQHPPPFPLHVDYEMMFRCNLRCPMCLMSLKPHQRAGYGRADQQLSEEEVKRLLEEGAAQGQRAMGFGGLWEPLLSPALARLIAFGRSRGLVDALFNTNGLLLTTDTAKALIESGLTKLMISVDAASEGVYAQMRAGSDFAKVTANIENFLNLREKLNSRLPLVRLSFCRTALNEHELEAFLERWRGTADFFSIQTYGRYESAAPPDFPKENVPPPPGRCAQPHKRLMVRHNGDVIGCCDASGLPLVLGNIQGQSLAEIWNGPQMADLRRRLAEGDLPPACAACQSKFAA